MDLEALVTDERRSEDIAGYSLDSFEVEASSLRPAHAKVSITLPEGGVGTGSFIGDGPIDAVFQAINSATGVAAKLSEFTIGAVTEGQDALGEVSVVLGIEGFTGAGQGVSTDTAHDVDVIGAVVAAQVAAPVLRTAGGGTLLVTSGGFADNPVPALASLSMGKAALRSAQTLIAAGVREDGIHAATVTIAGAVKPGTDFDPDHIAELFWTAHTDSKDAWQTEYRFTGA